jgi:threonine synthase
VFIPSDLEEQKVLATGVYGTNLVAVKGNYDDVNRLCTELSGEHEWAFVNINMRPYYAEGSKTLAFEIAEQLGWELPDRSSCRSPRARCSPKIARGFRGVDRARPARGRAARMNGAQAEGCSPVASAFAGARRLPAGQADTIAKSLAIGNPADGPYALDLARRTGGSIDSVTDDEIRAGIKLLARRPGSSPRRRAASRPPCWRKLAERGDIDPDERVVLVHHRRGPEDARRVRGTFETMGDRPDVEAFEAASPEAVAV